MPPAGANIDAAKLVFRGDLALDEFADLVVGFTQTWRPR